MDKFQVAVPSLDVREHPSAEAPVLGTVSENDCVERLATSDDGRWLKVRKEALVGWCARRFLTPFQAGDSITLFDPIITIAEKSSIAAYDWPDNRGVAPRGYVNGMALVFGRAYCRLRGGDPYALEMAKADTGDPSTDALSHYAEHFRRLGLENNTAGADTLRHLFVLLLGLGMREARAVGAKGGTGRRTTPRTRRRRRACCRPAGTRARRIRCSPRLFRDYRAKPSGFLDVFKKGVPAAPDDLENFGSGRGGSFSN